MIKGVIGTLGILVICLCALAGGALASFFGLVLDRRDRGESIVCPPSRCASCGARLRPIDLVPVLSYVWLRGRCRACLATIPRSALTGELTGAGFGALAGCLLLLLL